jgi:hypothetical protein
LSSIFTFKPSVRRSRSSASRTFGSCGGSTGYCFFSLLTAWIRPCT